MSVPDERFNLAWYKTEVERLSDIIESMRNYETEAEKQVVRDGEQIKELMQENVLLLNRAEDDIRIIVCGEDVSPCQICAHNNTPDCRHPASCPKRRYYFFKWRCAE